MCSARTSATSSDPLSELDPRDTTATAAPPRAPSPSPRRSLGDYAGRKGAYPTKLGVAVVVGLLAFAFFVVRGCQNNQIKLTQAQAVELAQKQVDFKSESTQIRLLRQGLSRHPFWVVSLSIPFSTPDDPRGFKQLAVVRIDATTGEVASVENQGPSEPGSDAGTGKQQKNN